MTSRLIPDDERRSTRWFAPACCVVRTQGAREVFVGGALVGRFGPQEQSIRNAILLGLAEDPQMHLGHLSEAFEISSETLRLLRKVMREEGFEKAVFRRYQGRAVTVLTPPMRRRIHGYFEQGLGSREVFVRLKKKVGMRTIETVRTEFLARRAATSASVEPPTRDSVTQLELGSAPSPSLVSSGQPLDVESVTAGSSPSAEVVSQSADKTPVELSMATSTTQASLASAIGAMREQDDDHRSNTTTSIQSAAHVQHAGAWVMVALAAREGLFERAQRAVKDRAPAMALRIALEAVVIALCIGQKCVEGVRRLQTTTASVLLRCQWAPSASWVRRILGLLSQEGGGFYLHLAMAAGYVRTLRAQGHATPVFYVDNHLRPYSGDAVIRQGWRMQAKRAVPGITDYYVHDEDGRPLFRIDVPEQESLTALLPRIVGTLREFLGAGDNILLAFDRAGAFPENMSALRNDGVSFVTYERRPYRELLPSEFTEELTLKAETIRYADLRTNLGKGRGRVRRIAMRVPDERKGHRQINLVAAGDEPAARLIEIMSNRWNQENGFKHGVERWGINQLDARTTTPYPQDAVIPNPARRRLDRAIRAARAREGKVRCALATSLVGSPARNNLKEQLAAIRVEVRELEDQRPSLPPSAPLQDTELASTLTRHKGDYKATIDSVRITCANIEADLALRLGPHMKRPEEAKKLIANLFCAPGSVQVLKHQIRVRLDPAGTSAERAALAVILAELSLLNLRLPGHPDAPPLYWEVQK